MTHLASETPQMPSSRGESTRLRRAPTAELEGRAERLRRRYRIVIDRADALLAAAASARQRARRAHKQGREVIAEELEELAVNREELAARMAWAVDRARRKLVSFEARHRLIAAATPPKAKPPLSPPLAHRLARAG